MIFKLPTQLLEDLHNDRILPVIGYGHPDFASKPITETANPVDGVEDWINLFGPHVWPLFHAVAHLPVNCILCLTPDPYFPRILESYDPGWLTLGLQQPDYPGGRRLILPLAGSLDSPQTVHFPDASGPEILQDREILWALAESFAARSRLLVIGFDPADETGLRLLARLQPSQPTQKRGWLICGAITPREQEAWEARGFEIVQGPPAQLLREIGRAGDTYSKPAPQGRTISKRMAPYKYLDYFGRDESAIFFGRSLETRRLCDLIFSHRLVVVTGPSGCGKTSLLNAGLLATTDHVFGYSGVYARVEDDPVTAIRREVAITLSVKGLLKKELTFSEFLSEARLHRGVTPIIVLDQAEELFTRVGDELRKELFLTIRSCLTATRLFARFVLSLRDDYLPRLAEVRNDLPAVLNNVFYVNELTRESAIEAMRLPAETAGIGFQASLAEQILDEIGLTTFSPPQLQIICTRLFEERPTNGIDQVLYRKLGGAKDILRHFLAQELAHLGKGAQTARQILKAMVTAEGTKDVLALQTIARRANLPEDQVENLLLYLRDHSRLLRGVQLKDGPRFELSHEYLTTEIWSWMTEADLRRREVEDLMDRELRSWRRFKHLRLGADRLEVFETNSKMVATDPDALTILLLSSLKHKGQAELWVQRIMLLDTVTQDRIAEQLFDYFHHRDRLQRRDAAEAIAALNPACLLRALSSASLFQRKAALEMLGGIEWLEAAPHIAALLNGSDRQTRILACGALGEIQGEVATAALKGAADDKDAAVSTAAIRAAARVETLDATAIIKRTLLKGNANLAKAAQSALEQARSAFHLQNLLNDNSISGPARQVIWNAVRHSSGTLVQQLSNILSDLSDRALEEASMNGNQSLKHEALKRLSKRGGPIAVAASQRLATEFGSRDDRAFERAEKEAARLVVAHADLDQLCEKFENQYFWFAAKDRLADGSQDMEALIGRLAKSGNNLLRIEAFRAVYSSNRNIEISERIILEGLADKDATVRYFACLAASRQKFPGLVEAVSILVEDSATPNSSLSEHNFLNGILSKLGNSVSDSAHHALDRLHPASKVWRKPFQETFKK
jgi:energy-coupling factor transporter ATP-binding protein EcfA2